MATPTVDLQQIRESAEAINQGQSTFMVTVKGLLERKIETDEEYVACLELSNEAARREKAMKDLFDPHCDQLHKAWKSGTSLRGIFMDPWTKLKDSLRDKAKRWYLDQQQQKREMEAALAKQAVQQQKALASQAQDLIDQGDVKAGRSLLMQAQATAAPILPDAAPKVEGARVTPKYKATCTDTIALARAVVNGEFDLMWTVRGVERPLLVVDQVVLNAIVDRMGKGLKCPGILVEDDVRMGATRL